MNKREIKKKTKTKLKCQGAAGSKIIRSGAMSGLKVTGCARSVDKGCTVCVSNYLDQQI